MLLILKSKRKSSDDFMTSLRLIGNHLEKKSVPFFISSFEDIEVYIETTKTDIFVAQRSITDFKTIFVRKVGVNYATAFILAFYAKRHAIQLVDNFRNNTGSRTKLIQMILLSSKGVSIPKTYFSPHYDAAHLIRAAKYVKFPVVVKQCSISKGAGVALAYTHDELVEKIAYFASQAPAKIIILQEFIPNTFEYRILVTGNTIATAEKKIRLKKDEFRNNVHLGAQEEFFNPKQLKKTLSRVALKAAQAVGIQVAGVDIVEDKSGTPVVFEVNSCPAFTLDESISDEIKMLSQYLATLENI